MPPGQTLQANRPTVEVGGQPQAALTNNLLRMTAVENAAGVHRCEASFNNWGTVGIGRGATQGFLYFDRALLDFGKRVVIKLASGTIIDGVITALGANFPSGGAPEISVVVEDRYRDLRLVRRTRTFQDVTASDIARQVANDYGLNLTCDLQGPTYKAVTQLNQSDLEFLRVRARLCDAELRLLGQQLYLKSRANSGAEALQLSLGSTLTSFDVVADTTAQATTVSAIVWDVASKSAKTASAGVSTLGSQLRGGSSGAQEVGRAFGQRNVNVPVAWADPQSQSNALFRGEAQRFVVGHATAGADAHIAVGSMIRLASLGPLFSGIYYVSEVNHTFDQQAGAITKFTVESPALGQTQ
jgi:phage protein D